MNHRLSIILGSLLGLSLIIPALYAHTIKEAADGEVAALFHIEPGHNPKAGKLSHAWFVLTLKGGTLIPLVQCNCKLAVFVNPRIEGNQRLPLLQPPLKAIKVEKYTGIPGATIIFPKPGQYELELKGTPKPGASFKQPFSLSYTVVVGG